MYEGVLTEVRVIMIGRMAKPEEVLVVENEQGEVVREFMGQQVLYDDRSCKDRSCFPVTGNLLLGRQHRLAASSTCGMQGRERFCIVSHLEEPTKCFYCDSTLPWAARGPNRLSHRIENVVTDFSHDKEMKWYQSENGKQHVTLQLDLEAEFQFTHLIMTFKSFRPAAMYIERSADFGKTWKVYRYFAYDCATSFPNITTGPAQKLSDVICISQYSEVSPSTGGELVYMAVNPHIKTADPWSDEVKGMTMITNLRFVMTKLHTLGDEMLDYRPEIDEKYYYAIYDIVVRGSCSCYGHANRCIPLDGQSVTSGGDVVHGRCDCMHNTEGLNCEKCKAFYNDLPWRPATQSDTNECRRCECNGHAARCHFDRAVYEASGFVSGGVCDDCQHNTQGKNCEQCKPFFYRDPRRPIYDPHVCLPCDCDKSGSRDQGICESEEDPERGLVAGKCYCKTFVDGPRCDRCKNGYWNLTAENEDGCVACTCNLLGTYNNEGCDKYSGKCSCKRLVTGENCDQCLPEHYGLSEDPDGCKACDCDIGGSVNNKCDLVTGQCLCREGFSGRRCETADSSFYCASIDHYTYEAENANITYGATELREVPSNRYDLTWTGHGFARVNERSSITFNVDNLQISQPYNVILRYDAGQDPIGWENIQVTVVRPDDPNPEGPCANTDPSNDFLIARFHPQGRYAEVRPAVCLEAGVKYEIRVQFGEKRTNSPDRSAYILVDSLVLSPPTEELNIFKESPRGQQHKVEYDRYQCRNLVLSLTPKEQMSETCQRYVCPVAAAIMNKTSSCDCDPTGSVSGICNVKGGQCECKPNVVGRRCDQCAVGTYGFGPSGCSECACDSVGSLHNNCDKQSGQCVCREKGIYGRQCNQCQPGFWSFPDCRVCQCNDHANICDQQTGACIECRDLTTGHYCERCQDGYYGDPRLGVGLACKPCPCPGGPTSGFQHADTCYLRPFNNTQDVICNCNAGYSGVRCAECATNHWGNPTEVGGSCQRCECNGNIDMGMAGSCDATTGECLKCLHNTEGAECENCVEGFFGDAKIRSCQHCVCNPLGTNSTAGACDRVTGQCPCFPNVVGEQCDQCAPNHFNLSSGVGCADCDCDPNGVILDVNGNPELQCNRLDGQCKCKPGRGGRTCSECEDYYWGDPTTADGCARCECNPSGSASQQCHRNNGTCVCLPGSGGALCNECARGYTGTWPYCQPCGECFHQWDGIIMEVKEKALKLVDTSMNIEDSGVASQYDKQFDEMDSELDEVRKKLADANISKEQIEQLESEVEKLKNLVAAAKSRLDSIEQKGSQTSQDVDFAQKDLEELQKGVQEIEEKSDVLHQKAEDIKAHDVQGAYNMTQDASETSTKAQKTVDAALGQISETESHIRATTDLLEKNKDDFDKQYHENEEALADLEKGMSMLEASLPHLNGEVCGAVAAPCDALCGGPGSCGFCGGKSCLDGAVSKAEQAKSFAMEADLRLNEKQEEAENVLTLVRDVHEDTEKANKDAQKALELAKEHSNQTNAIKTQLEDIQAQMNTFLKSSRSSPEQIRTLAEELMAMKIPVTHEDFKELTAKIAEAQAKVTKNMDINKILEETKQNRTIAANLETKAVAASERAAAIKNTTDNIRESLSMTTDIQAGAAENIQMAGEAMKQAKEDYEKTKEEVAVIEEGAKNANVSLGQLEGDVKKVKVNYLQIADDAKNAFESIDKAHAAAAQAEHGNKQIATDIETARTILDERSEGSDGQQKRAEALRQKAAKLLYKAQRHSEDIEMLTKDTSDVKLDDYERNLAELNSRLDQVVQDIQRKTEYFATCDV